MRPITWEQIVAGKRPTELPRKQPCIYGVQNLLTQKWYVGSTVRDIWLRWREHVGDFLHPHSHRRHGYKWLLALQTYPTTLWRFHLLEVTTTTEVLCREQHWIDTLDAFQEGYNTAPNAGSCVGRQQSTAERLHRSEVAKASPRVAAHVVRHTQRLHCDPDYKTRVTSALHLPESRQALQKSMQESTAVKAHMDELNQRPDVVTRRQQHNASEEGKQAIIQWNKSDAAREQSRQRMLAINADPEKKRKQMQGLLAGGFLG